MQEITDKYMHKLVEEPLSSVKDFYSLLKPRVMYLVVFTAFVGMFLAPGNISPFIAVSSIFAISLGSGAAGAFNMWYERDIDALMSRTKTRPIPAGIMDPSEAISFAAICGILSLTIMFLVSNIVATSLLAFAMFFYCYIYTVLLKRNTPQNIVIGGAAGSLPPMIGWAAVTGSISLESVILFLIIFLWTPPHFWALALKKSKEYENAGIPMLPNIKGDRYTKINIVIYSILLVTTSLIPFFLGFCGKIYVFVALLLGIKFIYFSIKLYYDKKNSIAMSFFWFSIMYLFSIFSFLVIDKILLY